MTLKLLGGIFIIFGCGGIGFVKAASHRREARILAEFISAIAYMQCEMQYRITPLPDLCAQTALQCTGVLRYTFSALADELNNQISPDVECCMLSALEVTRNLPKLTYVAMRSLGRALGNFGLEGQLKELDVIYIESKQTLTAFTKNQEVKLRSYQTLGICAGAVLVILFI
ncbi:MAG: stage III sporulation protein AB [Oscillospiraceae bacterium]|nr:stage III sporulation protein AB [Oscillospiraceae bacterium]